jgi:lipoyl-dependent peroxiredoxin
VAKAERRAEVVWDGDLAGGSGTTSGTSGAFGDLPVSWAARTEAPEGKTSPEELIAAAHAACYAMALSGALARGGTPPERLEVSATCSFDQVGDGYRITTMELDVRGRVPGLDEPGFEQAAEQANDGCPVSNALRGNVEITVTPHLEQA